jgi:hypothetical protein
LPADYRGSAITALPVASSTTETYAFAIRERLFASAAWATEACSASSIACPAATALSNGRNVEGTKSASVPLTAADAKVAGGRLGRVVKLTPLEPPPPETPPPPEAPPLVTPGPPLNALPLDWAPADRASPRIKIARPRSRFIRFQPFLLQTLSVTRHHFAQSSCQTRPSRHFTLIRREFRGFRVNLQMGARRRALPEAKSKLTCVQDCGQAIRFTY